MDIQMKKDVDIQFIRPTPYFQMLPLFTWMSPFLRRAFEMYGAR